MVGCEITHGKKMTVNGSCLKQKASTETNNTSISGIPKLVNYIWLSDFRNAKKNPINLHFLHCELENNLEILHIDKGYKHIIWTDNPSTVQDQIDYLGYKNVSVQDVNQYVSKFSLWTNYREFFREHYVNQAKVCPDHPYIQNEEIPGKGAHWEDYNESCRKYNEKYFQLLMEIDFLKYSILYETGGIIADLNFQFQAPLLEKSMKECDFLSLASENSFMAAKKGEPLIEKIIEVNKILFEKDPTMRTDSFFKYGYRYTISDTLFREYEEALYNDHTIGFDIRHQESSWTEALISLTGIL